MARIILAPQKEWMAANGAGGGYLTNSRIWISITLVPVGPVLKWLCVPAAASSRWNKV